MHFLGALKQQAKLHAEEMAKMRRKDIDEDRVKTIVNNANKNTNKLINDVINKVQTLSNVTVDMQFRFREFSQLHAVAKSKVVDITDVVPFKNDEAIKEFFDPESVDDAGRTFEDRMNAFERRVMFFGSICDYGELTELFLSQFALKLIIFPYRLADQGVPEDPRGAVHVAAVLPAHGVSLYNLMR